VAVQPLAGDDPAFVSGYRLQGRLGAGGMGRVYLAFTPGGRPVAVKVLRPELGDDPQFRARFGQEIAAARRVHGLFTAQLLDGDPNGNPPWLATAYVAGPSLAQVVTEHGPLPTQTVLLLMAGVAEALAAIHAAGLVHRDLKPSNVLLAADGPRVIDFGIARAADATVLTRAGMRVGSPQFMAPEQIRGGEVTAAADVFALGALAAFASTGRAPFGEGVDAAMYRVLHEDPDLRGCPDRVRALAGHCLAKNPAARPTPAQIIEYCRAWTPTGTLAFTESWLPPAIAAGLASHAAPGPTVGPPAGAAPYGGAGPYVGAGPLVGAGPYGGPGPVGAGPYSGDPSYQDAAPYRVPPPGTGPTMRRTLLGDAPSRRRRRLSTPMISTLAAVIGVIVGLSAYGLVNLATSGPTATAYSCLVGTWAGEHIAAPFSDGSVHMTFTGTGPTLIFRSDRVYVVQYGPAATVSARMDGSTFSVTYTGSATGHYTARNGTLLVNNESARASYAFYANSTVEHSGPLPKAPKPTSARYTCSANSLHLSYSNGDLATLARLAS
jgi:protein kinase-like protein